MIRRLIAIACVLLAATLASAQGDVAPTVATAEALVAAVAAGGVVWVEPGDYVIAQTLVIGHDVELRDHTVFAPHVLGRAVVTGRGNLFERNGFANEEQLISAVYVGDQAHFRLEGGDVFRDNPGGAVEIAGAAWVTLFAPTVEATGTWAHTYVVGNATLTVEGGRFADNDGAFYVGDGARASLENVVIAGGAAEAVYVDESAFVVVRGGRIEGHAEVGVVASGSGRVHVEGVHVAGNRSGLVAGATPRVGANAYEDVAREVVGAD